MLRWFNTFRNRIVLLSGGLLLSLSFILVTYFYQLASSRLTIASGESLLNIGQSIANMLTANLAERKREIVLLSQRSSLYRDQNLVDLQEVIDQIKNSSKSYAWIGFANPKGVVLASGNGMLKGVDVSKRPWFIKGSKGPYIGDVHKALLLESMIPKTKDGSPVRFLDFSAPVFNKDGELKGVIATHANWMWVKEVLAESLTEGSKRKGINVLILDSYGKVLYPDKWQDEIKLPKQLPSSDHFSTLLWPDNTYYLTSITALRETVPGQLGWKILVRQPVDLALSSVSEVHRLLLILGGIATLLCMFVAYKFANSLSRPLERLALIAQRIKNGDRHITFQDESRLNEVASLSESLQGMMSSLLDREQNLMRLNITLESKVQERTAELEAANKFLQSVTRLDPLTQSYNRLALNEMMQEAFLLSQSARCRFAIIMADADHFKRVNDKYGHSVGDKVLKRIASLFRDLVTDSGIVARFGGEEFTVLLKDTDETTAKHIAEQLRVRLAQEEIQMGLKVTASFGVALSKPDDKGYEYVLQRADLALYSAKDQGRNRVVIAD